MRMSWVRTINPWLRAKVWPVRVWYKTVDFWDRLLQQLVITMPYICSLSLRTRRTFLLPTPLLLLPFTLCKFCQSCPAPQIQRFISGVTLTLEVVCSKSLTCELKWQIERWKTMKGCWLSQLSITLWHSEGKVQYWQVHSPVWSAGKHFRL